MAYRLYILMRTDMASMNPGKGMAQAAHAANDAIAQLEQRQSPLLDEWRDECGTFGTTIVVGVNSYNQLIEVLDEFSWSGWILDPTYPIIDGSVVHLVPVVTCGWVFADEMYWKEKKATQELSLHP